ncbi:galactose/glucose ABC transporter substrate-binding protein MglB [Neobacillus thermocopriae]|uniref:D-galactose/methyl-galactoside binding periplasmic protein MglB n=1 Tax=Neobacillus thermocopriae TaxID=1215031 RepID=A0A6B3TNG0_9BACI|nr:galactose/glucose ABC transporter substrate-binding protein MglB [Neobacillus thermocopriae]MED3622604.1 galactose/glucose ABC transporter substrate-binding protein MglB [Neobacillus thermocopriae]MED3714305.1 galactose/glucose ABC transporter substrate-binding protein MglB [Neobacillus thermocopriae]NEX77839.1 galactose/glucose ABC transporter substrate-binding protein MglB [Neobacillus thermocopriae]
MKKKKGMILSLTVASSILLAAGCSSSTGGSSDAGKEKEGLPAVGATIYKFDDNFMSYVRRAMEDTAKGKVNLMLNDSQNDQAKQIEQIDTLIAKGAKSLAINLVDPKAAQTVVDKAKTKNIPVIFFNKEPDESVLKGYDKAYYVGTTSSESGVIQGELIAKAWEANKDKWDKNGDGKIQYVLLKGEPGHPDAEARTKFAVDTIKEKGIQVEELALDTAMWDATKATEKMDAWISKYNDTIEFVIANNDGMALGAIASLEKAGYFSGDKFMPVVGVDAIPEALEMIEKDKMVGTVLNDAKNQGKATIELATNAANGKDVLEGTEWKLDDKKAVRVPYVEITKENIQVGKDAYK